MTDNKERKVKENQKRKFDTLAGKRTHGNQDQQGVTSALCSKWVINLSLKELSDVQIRY